MTHNSTWTHKFVSSKYVVSSKYDPAFLRVTAGLHYLEGNARPHFSVTGDTRNGGGCIHDVILKHWPELAPVVALHLSDDTGAPMHAVANAWYQLAGYYGGAGERYHAGNGLSQHWTDEGAFNGYRPSTPVESLAAFAEYVRIPLDEALTLADGWRCEDDWTATRRWFTQWIETQRARWQAEADAAVARLDALIAAQVKETV